MWIALGALVVLVAVPIAGLVVLSGADELDPGNVIGVVTPAVSAAGAIAAALFSLKVVAEASERTTETIQRTIERAEERTRRDALLEELSEHSADDPPGRGLVLRGRRNGISFEEQGEATGLTAEEIRQIAALGGAAG